MDKITHKVRCEQWAKIIKECLASGIADCQPKRTPVPYSADSLRHN